MAQHEMLGPVEPRTWLMGTEAFEGVMPHHGGIKALWETKWRVPVRYLLRLPGRGVRIQSWELGIGEWGADGCSA